MKPEFAAHEPEVSPQHTGLFRLTHSTQPYSPKARGTPDARVATVHPACSARAVERFSYRVPTVPGAARWSTRDAKRSAPHPDVRTRWGRSRARDGSRG